MKVIVSEKSGFCFGVQRAVDTVERVAREGGTVVTLGPIVHNRHVVERFNALGVREAGSVVDIPDGATVIIRAHGVGRAVYEALEARGLRVVDATCPFVERIHKLVRRSPGGGAPRGAGKLALGGPEAPGSAPGPGGADHLQPKFVEKIWGNRKILPYKLQKI